MPVAVRTVGSREPTHDVPERCWCKRIGWDCGTAYVLRANGPERRGNPTPPKAPERRKPRTHCRHSGKNYTFGPVSRRAIPVSGSTSHGSSPVTPQKDTKERLARRPRASSRKPSTTARCRSIRWGQHESWIPRDVQCGIAFALEDFACHDKPQGMHGSRKTNSARRSGRSLGAECTASRSLACRGAGTCLRSQLRPQSPKPCPP